MPSGGVLRLRINRGMLQSGHVKLEQESIVTVYFASIRTVLGCSCGPHLFGSRASKKAPSTRLLAWHHFITFAFRRNAEFAFLLCSTQLA